jgi:hypothetical protein
MWPDLSNELLRSKPAGQLNHASPLCPLSACGEGKDEVRGEANIATDLREIISI